MIMPRAQRRLRAAEGAGPRAGRPGPGVPRAHPARVGAVQAHEERGLRGQARGHRRDVRVVARQALAQGQGACQGLSGSAVGACMGCCSASALSVIRQVAGWLPCTLSCSGEVMYRNTGPAVCAR